MSWTRVSAWLGAIAELRLPGPLQRFLARRWVAIVALVVILALSIVSRLIHLDQPCTSPCRTPAQHTLIFDEAFYVNAARAIARVHQPSGSPYASSPAGKDPNAEHPQLAKLAMAAGIELFGDNEWGWRIGSVLFSTIAMLALYFLVTGAGGSRWLGVGTVGVMALDNLALVHGRIATLDIYVMAMMLVAGALYVRRRPALAGIALGVGMCMKEVAVWLLVALVIYALACFHQDRFGRAAPVARGEPRRPLWRDGASALVAPVTCIVWTAVAFFGLLWILDLAVPAWDPGLHKTYGGSPFTHFHHMVKFANSIKANTKNPGISSTPLQWLLDKRSINYATTAVTVSKTAHGVLVSRQVTTTIAFRGVINPYIIFVTIPSLVMAIGLAWRNRDRVALVGICWAVGTYAPFFFWSQILDRTSYLFYMLIVLPGIYIMAARVFASHLLPRLAALVWAGLLVYGFIHLYPFRTLIG